MTQPMAMPHDAPQLQGRDAAPAPADRPRRVRLLRRLGRDTRGVTAVEFAIIGPLFLVLIFAILENALILWSQAVLDNATRDAARLTMTGQSSSGTLFPTQLCKGIPVLMNCADLQYRIQTGTSFGGMSAAITENSNGTFKNFVSYPTAPAATSAGQFVLIQVIYNRPFIVPWVGKLMSSNGKTELLSTEAFENEPY